jgi:hypothetical protein
LTTRPGKTDGCSKAPSDIRDAANKVGAALSAVIEWVKDNPFEAALFAVGVVAALAALYFIPFLATEAAQGVGSFFELMAMWGAHMPFVLGIGGLVIIPGGILVYTALNPPWRRWKTKK